jgi:hypothetical protein
LDIQNLKSIFNQQQLILVYRQHNQIDNNQWAQINDLSQKEGEMHWQLFDMNSFSPVLKSIEGMEVPELVTSPLNVQVSIIQ